MEKYLPRHLRPMFLVLELELQELLPQNVRAWLRVVPDDPLGVDCEGLLVHLPVFLGFSGV